MLSRLVYAAVHLNRLAGPALRVPFRVLDRTAERLAAVLFGLGLALLAGVRRARLEAGALGADLHRLAQRHVLPPSARTPEPPTAFAAGSSPGYRQVAVASAVVLLLGVAVGGQSGGDRSPAPGARVTLSADETRQPLPQDDLVDVFAARPEARPVPPQGEAAPSAPAPPPVPAVAPGGETAAESARWLPTGTGMWLHEWEQSEGGSAGAVVDRAKATGLTHLFVQTGSTKKGWIGDEVLSELLPATAGTGLSVIAWDFPKLIDPEDDARRLARAVLSTPPGAPRVAAVAPDVETASEGTHVTPHAVLGYYRELRRQLPPDVAVLAAVPWPSEKRTSSYPYAETAAHSDAFIPMAYWYNRAPGVVTETSMRWLAQFGLPVMPVGQGYDGRLDAPYLPPDPDPAASVQAFVDAARAGGAASISLWSWQTTGGPQWDVLARAGAGPWPAPPPAPAPPPPPEPPPPPADPVPAAPPLEPIPGPPPPG